MHWWVNVIYEATWGNMLLDNFTKMSLNKFVCKCGLQAFSHNADDFLSFTATSTIDKSVDIY